MSSSTALLGSDWPLESLAGAAADKSQWEPTVSLDRIKDNNYRNHEIADYLEYEQPQLADKLRQCCEFVQQQDDGHWQAAYHCRQHHYCGHCHALKSRLLREQFIASSWSFAEQYGLQTRLASFVLHPHLPSNTRRGEIVPLSAAAIQRFGEQMKQFRYLNNFCIVHPARRQWMPKNRLIGPMMLSAHVRPLTKTWVRYHWAKAKEDMHLHILACLPKRYLIRTLQKLMLSIWRSAQREVERLIGPIGIEVKQERLAFENDNDVRQFIGYTARKVRPEWNPQQALRVSRLVVDLPRTAGYRLLGRSQPLGHLPHRTPIYGDAMRYSHRDRKFVPVFLDSWT